MSTPGDSISPSVYRARTQPGLRSTSVVGYVAEASMPSSGPPGEVQHPHPAVRPAQQRRRMPGPGHDARPRAGSSRRYRQLANSSEPRSISSRLVLRMTSPGACPTVVYARTAVRICPISPAAVTLCPCTSPITAAASAVRGHQVVEVAADLHAPGGGQIAGGRLEAGQRRQRGRQQRRLQAVGQLVLGVVQQGPVQGLRDQPAPGWSAPPARRVGNGCGSA